MADVRESGAPSNSDLVRRRGLVVALAVVAVVGVGAVCWAIVSTAASRRTVGELLASTPGIHPREVTASLCDDGVGCVEGWRTDIGDYLRFEPEGKAEYWAAVLGDEGRRSGSIVLDLRHAQPVFDDRRRAIDVLFAWRDFS